jgi:hypothetical protein
MSCRPEATSGHVHVKADRSKSITDRPDGFNFKFRSKRPMNARHTRELTRALFKITLGLIYLEEGADVAFSERFDPIRAMRRGVAPIRGYLLVAANEEYIRRSFTLCSVQYFPVSDENKRTILVKFDYTGVVLATYLQTRNPDYFGALPEEYLLFRFWLRLADSTCDAQPMKEDGMETDQDLMLGDASSIREGL